MKNQNKKAGQSEMDAMAAIAIKGVMGFLPKLKNDYVVLLVNKRNNETLDLTDTFAKCLLVLSMTAFEKCGLGGKPGKKAKKKAKK
jgi:hypothetical protein